MSMFDRMDRIMSRTVDRSFAKPFTCTPVLQSPNGRPIADPAKPAWSGNGVFDEAAEPAGIEVGNRDGTGNSFRTMVTGHQYELSIDRNAYPKADEIQQGDRIQVTGDSELYRVSSVRRDGMSRVVVALSR